MGAGPDPAPARRARGGTETRLGDDRRWATEVPLETASLKSGAPRRAGIARLGSFWGHGSGDIAIAFSTGICVDDDESHDPVRPCSRSNEARIHILFRAAAEAMHEAVC